MSLLIAEGLSARVDGRLVLDGASLSVSAREVVAVCGPNGAGKSSLLKAVAGLLKVHSGQVQLGGHSAQSMSARETGEALAYLAQERSIAWNMPAAEVAALGEPFLSGVQALSKARAALDALGIGHLADRGVAEMSGGERARVLLARALVSDAPLLLADEPVAGLDPDAALLVLDVLKARAKSGKAVVLTLHDLNLAAAYADRVVVVAHGRVVADAAPLEALSPEVLRRYFHIDGQWIANENGPLLATRRLVSA
ncbi:MAG: ABC transporter ATP-binding protein [Janthinobacterium lividum]